MGRWWVAVWLMLAAAMGPPAFAQQKIALVIGISDYKVGGKLPQTLIDAGKISAALTEVGFSTQTLVKPALSKAELDDALLDFSVRAERADVALLYFAGHGMQYGDNNWLIPASAELRAESHIRREGIPLNDVVELMGRARFRIVILDACRNNPFVVNWGATRSSGDGLARLPESLIPVGSMVAFSAAPGQKVPDNGIYADALAKWIKADGVELKQMMDRVRRDVQQRTPAAAPEFVAKYDGAFSFGAGYQPNASAGVDLDSEKEKVAWNMAKAADTGESYRAYLSIYPNGPNAPAAWARIEELRRAASQSAANSASPAPSSPAPPKIMQVCQSQGAGSCPFSEVPSGYSAESQMCRAAAAQRGIQMVFRPEAFAEDIRACEASQRALGYR